MVERGCPNCGSLEYLKLDADALDTYAYLCIKGKGVSSSVSLCLCANCGVVYIDRPTLMRLVAEANNKC